MGFPLPEERLLTQSLPFTRIHYSAAIITTILKRSSPSWSTSPSSGDGCAATILPRGGSPAHTTSYPSSGSSGEGGLFQALS